MAESHWKLGRRRQRALSESTDAEANAQEAAAVGEILRRSREQRGLDLRQVADNLHIRFPYLQAIENSLIDELPGPTYALGFVKAYAEYLDLDSDTIVERFKAEQRGLNSKTELVFPSPLPEGKVPSAAILIVAAVMAVAAYSGWMYFSDVDERVAEVVPPLPDKVKQIAKKAAADASKLSATATTNAESAENSVDVKQDAPSTGDNFSQTVAENDPVPRAAEEKTVSTETEQGSADPSDTASNAAGAALQTSKAVAATKASIGEDVAAVTTPAAKPTDTAPPAAEPVARPQEESSPIVVSPRAPKVYGLNTSDARIVMLARSATWVEIRDGKSNEVFLTRVLYEGDRYIAPNRPGLVLMTGNAGGIEITVDGEKVPSIGPKGSVRRNVQLDPLALRQGQAVRDAIGLQQQQSEVTPKPDAAAP